MPPSQASDPTTTRVVTDAEIMRYEGLVRKTASMYAPFVDPSMEYDDVCSVLRLKVWQALKAFDPSRTNLPVERIVYGFVKNRAIDLVKRRNEEVRKRDPLYIEDLAPQVNGAGAGQPRDAFESRYLSQGEEEALAEVLDTPPLIPSTLTDREKCVLVLLYNSYKTAETAALLKITKREVLTAVKSLRVKMADWLPSDSVPINEPQPA